MGVTEQLQYDTLFPCGARHAAVRPACWGPPCRTFITGDVSGCACTGRKLLAWSRAALLIQVGTLPTGEIDYDHFARELKRNSARPAIVNVNVGTTVKVQHRHARLQGCHQAAVLQSLAV